MPVQHTAQAGHFNSLGPHLYLAAKSGQPAFVGFPVHIAAPEKGPHFFARPHFTTKVDIGNPLHQAPTGIGKFEKGVPHLQVVYQKRGQSEVDDVGIIPAGGVVSGHGINLGASNDNPAQMRHRAEGFLEFEINGHRIGGHQGDAAGFAG